MCCVAIQDYLWVVELRTLLLLDGVDLVAHNLLLILEVYRRNNLSGLDLIHGDIPTPNLVPISVFPLSKELGACLRHLFRCVRAALVLRVFVGGYRGVQGHSCL